MLSAHLRNIIIILKGINFFSSFWFSFTSKTLIFSLQAMVLQQNGNLMELVDPELGSEFSKEEATIIIKVALLCINPSPALRPTMTAVVSMLEGRTVVPELTMEAGIYANDVRFESFRGQCQTLRASLDRASFSHRMQYGLALLLHLPMISIRLISTLSNMKRMLPISSHG